MDNSEIRLQLDQIRGLLFAMANTGDDFLSPASSIALHHALAARGRKTGVSEFMQQLLRLREVQDLPRGNWLPVTTRAVPLGECALLVSGAPTSHVEHDFGVNCFGRGIGRLLDGSKPSAIPTESLARWLQTPLSSVRWALAFIGSVRWADPFGHEDFEIFNHWSNRPDSRWAGVATAKVPDGVAVAKHKLPSGQVDHYLLHYRRGRAEQLVQLVDGDVAHRLRIGLLANAGNHRSWSLHFVGKNEVELTTFYLPNDESRLLEAVAEVDSSEKGVVATMPVAAVDTVCGVLTALGLKERSLSHG